jgi:hypothetical protein
MARKKARRRVTKREAAAILARGHTKEGGKARWRDVPPEARSEILRRAAQARWAKAKRKKDDRG